MPHYRDLFLLSVVTAVGGWLLLTALRRGEGTDPHCGNCGYNLNSLSTNRCPECGVLLTQEMISTGPKAEIQPQRLWLGLIFIAIPLGWSLFKYFFKK